MAWITKTKNSGEIEAEAKVPDTRAGAEATVGELFLVRLGSMANDEGSGPNRHKKIRQRGPTLDNRIIWRIEAK